MLLIVSKEIGSILSQLFFFYAEKREEKSGLTAIDQSIPIMENFLPNRWSFSSNYIPRICFKII